MLGDVDEIVSLGGEPLTVCGRIDWARPDHIPALWRPGSLPSGAGTAILNRIAEVAAAPLRYRGPYPSAALFTSLADCFRTTGSLASFIEGGQEAALVGRPLEPAHEFTPAPFTRTTYLTSSNGLTTGEICVQRRDGRTEAAFVLGRRFDLEGEGARRLVVEDGETRAVFELAGHRVATVVALDDDGRPLGAPAPPPPLAGAHLGEAVAPAIAAALWQVALAAAPRLLRDSLAALGQTTPIVWADCQLSAASFRDGRIELHAGHAASALEGSALMRALAMAMIPVAHRAAQAYAEARAPEGAGS